VPPEPESHIRPGCETPAIFAGPDAARRALCPCRKLAWFYSAPQAWFYSVIDTALVAVAAGPAGLSKTITFETKALALRI
jgi:hypothetical protein